MDDFDQIDWERVKDKIKDWSKENSKKIKTGIGIALGAAALFSGIYFVGPNSEAVVKRLGKYSRTATSGINVKIPFGIETADVVPTKLIQKEEFGFRTKKSDVRSTYKTDDEIFREEKVRPSEEKTMLTGDLNVADVEYVIQYKIENAQKYLFNLKEQRKAIRDLGAVVMRQIVGDRSIDEVITIGRTDIQAEAQKNLQEILDSYDSGIKITQVIMQAAKPPTPVEDAFNEVNKAKADKETLINNALAGYNAVIPEARGEAERRINQAQGYAIERINNATGDAKRFNAVYNEYSKAPEVTKNRLYFEGMKNVLQDVGNIWIVEENNSGIMKFLPLNNMIKSKKADSQEGGQ